MTIDARDTRFCTCSESPAQVGISASAEESAGSSLEDTAKEGADISETREATSRFCTCAPTPAPAPTIKVDRRETLSDQTLDVADEDTVIGQVAAPVETAGPDSDQTADAASGSVAGSNVGSGTQGDAPMISSISDLLPDETALFTSTTHGRGGSEVVLTERRVVLRGAPDADVLHASMRFAEIDSVTISRSRPNRRSLIWGLVGIGAAIGMWQALDGVGNLRLIIAVIVLLMSGILLADYFLRPPDLQVGLRAKSGVEMKVGFGQSHADEADRFAARVVSMMEMR